MPAAPCRVEAVLPDGLRLEKELKSAEAILVVLEPRKRSKRLQSFRRSIVSSLHFNDLLIDRELSSRRAVPSATDFGIGYFPWSASDSASYHRGAEPGTLVSLAQLGFQSGFQERVQAYDRTVSSRPLASRTEIASWLGIGVEVDRPRILERISEQASVRFTPTQAVAELEAGRYRLPIGSRDSTLRRYGLLTDEGTRFVIPLPVEGDHEESLAVDVRLTVRGRFGNVQSRTVKVEARPKDGVLGSMLALVQRGEIASARSVMSAASQMLFEKFANPYLAALAAHVLLGADGVSGDGHWHRWVKNLAERFPHIPDGKIVLAALMLKKATGIRSDFIGMTDYDIVQNAKNACLEAVSNGLPQYSASIRLLARTAGLIAGFEQSRADFVSSFDADSTSKLLSLTQWLSTHVDPHQGLTVAQLSEYEPEYA